MPFEPQPERERLARAIRELIDHVVDSEAPPEVFEEAADEMARLAELLGPHPRRGPKQPHLPDLGDLQRTFWRDPVIGKSNPIAPPVDIEITGERVVVGRANLGFGYEGPPGYAHGAVIAGIFDQILGLANLASGNVGMTGTLTIRYRKPTPLHTDLVFRGQTDRVSGRKIYVTGTLHAEDTLTAEAQGLFVNLARPTAAEYFEGRAEAEG
ncbi:MAG: PaaI family thioesterase [Actinomycetota bacterium]